MFFLSLRLRGKEKELDRALEAIALGVELLQLGERKFAELGVAERFLVVRDLSLDVAVAREGVDDRLQIAPLLVELRRASAIGEHVRPAENLFELAVATGKLLQLVDRDHQAARAGAVSARSLGAASSAS